MKAILPDIFRSRVESRIRKNRMTPGLTDQIVGGRGRSFITLTTKADGYPLKRITGFKLYYTWAYGYWDGTISGGSGTGYNPYNFFYYPTAPTGSTIS
jgi:hypothetical protein